MDGKQKVTRAWAIKYPNGYVHIWAIRARRRDAIAAFCENGEHSKPDSWTFWRKRGYLPVKVEIREAT